LDRSRRRSGLLIAIAAAASLGAAATAPLPLRAMRWLAPGADVSRILARRPVECLTIPRNRATAYSVELGRAAFRTPLLLGGQAARAGVACETCHRNGRTNPDFDFPGLSGAPGTADVTSFVFSSHRGDHVDDPRPIPDLGGPKSALRISQAPGSPALKRFIHGLVTEEFDGAEPPPAVLTGLAAYVRALSPAACSPRRLEPVRVESDIDDARRAVRAAQGALARGDAAAALLMVQAARSRLGDIAERYGDPALRPTRQNLVVADLDLAATLAAIRQSKPAGAERLSMWLARSHGWAAAVERDEARSLYEPRALAAASAPRGR
jgi:hypothetical protein